jgi:hypothetical protein
MTGTSVISGVEHKAVDWPDLNFHLLRRGDHY